jgi:sugar/nucleoside kinase (ribokinase family)
MKNDFIIVRQGFNSIPRFKRKKAMINFTQGEERMGKLDVICIGVALMDLPLGPVDEALFSGETTMVPAISLTTGGDALNESIILARLGKKSALVGHIGKDMLGDIIASRCEAEGIECSRLRRDPEISTRINVVMIGKNGQRHFIKTQSAASGSFRMEEIDFGFISEAKAVSLASIFCSKLRDPEVILRIVKTARENGLITFADMVPMTGGETLKDIAGAMPYLDYFLPNVEEAAMLTGLEKPDEMADSLLKCGIKNVIIKLGKEGCLIKGQKERWRIPSCPANVIDTTGAGDNFAAGFITAVLDGKNLKECGAFANAVAGISTEFVGATEGVKNKRQIEAYQALKRE